MNIHVGYIFYLRLKTITTPGQGSVNAQFRNGFLALKFAYSTELLPIGLQDEEQTRKRRYLYAAFICGLFHDAGKIFDVDVISSTRGVKAHGVRSPPA